ncbi:MAG: type II toxin-antitoxin system RelE/ParE family toxin [Clostridia bacterium]|nr:type II toxin-antitoxin system RelE/ParE family toxin [Clostridia bacterium]
MASDYKLLFTDAAARDLDETLSYLCGKLKNPVAAKHLFDGMQAALGNLCAFPRSGEAVENEFLILQGVRRVTVDNYNLYYSPDESRKTITVLRILYGRRDLNAILREMGM